MVFIFVIIVCLRIGASSQKLYNDTQAPDFIESNGYIAETHDVTTEDGYIVCAHRIVGKQSNHEENEIKRSTKGRTGELRPTVLIQHGIAGRSDNWLLSGPKSFPYLLANEGYDVWLADSRGNSYSTKHTYLSTKSPEFWDFSFHEQGLYDLSALTDYILNVTGQSKIFYVGHSRGTTMALVLLSTRPEYNNKYHLVTLFSPVAYIKYAKSPFLRTAFKTISSQDIKRLDRRGRSVAIPGINRQSVDLRNVFCGNRATTQPVCSQTMFLLSGFDYELFNRSMVPLIVAHFPDGGSLKEYLHFIQIAKTDRFEYYDHGREENQMKYGRPDPPQYEIENITAPVALYYGDNDYVVSSSDFDRLYARLKYITTVYRVPFKKFTHTDFLFATRADELLYKPAIRHMNKFLSTIKK